MTYARLDEKEIDGHELRVVAICTPAWKDFHKKLRETLMRDLAEYKPKNSDTTSPEQRSVFLARFALSNRFLLTRTATKSDLNELVGFIKGHQTELKNMDEAAVCFKIFKKRNPLVDLYQSALNPVDEVLGRGYLATIEAEDVQLASLASSAKAKQKPGGRW